MISNNYSLSLLVQIINIYNNIEKIKLKKLPTVDLVQILSIKNKNDKIKILGGGTISTKLEVKAHAFTKSAKEAIEKLQGTTEIL